MVHVKKFVLVQDRIQMLRKVHKCSIQFYRISLNAEVDIDPHPPPHSPQVQGGRGERGGLMAVCV